MKAQAVVIDGLFLLMLCALAAAFLLWASSTYGNTSFKAYYFMYMGEYNAGVLNCLTEVKYHDPGFAPGVLDHFWLGEVGDYMKGVFNEEDAPGVPNPQYVEMMKQWHTICLQSPHPLELKIFVPGGSPEEGTIVRGNSTSPLVFGCPLSPSDPEGKNITEWVDDYQRGICPLNETGIPLPCDSDPPFKYTCPQDLGDPSKGAICKAPPPYYSSGTQRKLCGDVPCMMEAKIYY